MSWALRGVYGVCGHLTGYRPKMSRPLSAGHFNLSPTEWQACYRSFAIPLRYDRKDDGRRTKESTSRHIYPIAFSEQSFLLTCEMWKLLVEQAEIARLHATVKIKMNSLSDHNNDGKARRFESQGRASKTFMARPTKTTNLLAKHFQQRNIISHFLCQDRNSQQKMLS